MAKSDYRCSIQTETKDGLVLVDITLELWSHVVSGVNLE